MPVIYREQVGRPLTWAEVDANFRTLLEQATAVTYAVRFDIAQTLNAAQQAQAQANMGLGSAATVSTSSILSSAAAATDATIAALKGAANGLAPLGADQKVPSANLPDFTNASNLI